MRAVRNAIAVLALMGVISGPDANAATVDIAFHSFARADAQQALVQRDAFIGLGRILSEDFESGFTPCRSGKLKPCSSGSILSSELGTFTGFGGASSSGGSQVKPKDKIVVRTAADSVSGRYNVTPGGANWLDSNDREGIDWVFAAPRGVSFQRLAFLLTDLDDVGKVVFSLTANGNQPVARPGTAPGGNARLHLITLMFDEPVRTFSLRMVNGTGDGFGLDGARLAAVPLPAAGLLLLGVVGGLVALARRRRAA